MWDGSHHPSDSEDEDAASRHYSASAASSSADLDDGASNHGATTGRRGSMDSSASSIDLQSRKGGSRDDEYAASQPRGKPEAMAVKLAAARAHETKEELEKEKTDEDNDDDDDNAVTAEVVVETSAASSKPASKPKTKATKKAAAASPKKRRPTTTKKKATNRDAITMNDPVHPITEAEYHNVQQLMIQFCRVPLLAEFSRPVALLHPEMMGMYTRIVKHPIDLGKVCRGIRRREYECLRDIQLDMWRIFSNCVQFHSSPANKVAVPSFLSIALHLRQYFNALWQEFMIASDPPVIAQDDERDKQQRLRMENIIKKQMLTRSQDREKRLTVSGLTIMTGKSIERAANSMRAFVESGGKVDGLDTEAVFGDDADETDDPELQVVVDNLRGLLQKLNNLVASQDEYGIDEFDKDLKKCYTDEVLENNPSLRYRIANRLNRFLGKIIVPIHEANCRGVTQSSIWGCMAAAVWARESRKKPFWPALVLGIMAPKDQKEDWHIALTKRNETRLPQKLRTQLNNGKRKAELSIKKQAQGLTEPQSFFLVEFLGTHEFTWVKESDIIENFDPFVDDPNQPRSGGDKKRSGKHAHIVGNKTYKSALEEGKWALEEFELQLQDSWGDSDGEENGEEMNYSYGILCQSDDEAEEEQAKADHLTLSLLDIDECNELLSTEGLLDFSAMARKNARKRAQEMKKRAQEMKKQQLEAAKKQKAEKVKKQKAEVSKKRQAAKTKERVLKKEQKEMEKRRKKRSRDREKALKQLTPPKNQKEEDALKAASGRRNMIIGKRDRANAVVQGYLHRASEKQEYKSLGFGGVMGIPASNVEPTGLLGMALAFRAAAGEVAMPDDTGEQVAQVTPWLALDASKKKTSKERMEILKKQVELLEAGIETVKKRTETRKRLKEDTEKELTVTGIRTQRHDLAARENPLKKKRKISIIAATPDKAPSSLTPSSDKMVISSSSSPPPPPETPAAAAAAEPVPSSSVTSPTTKESEGTVAKSPLDHLLEAAKMKEETDDN